MASAYRDRTAEFRSLTTTLKKIGGENQSPNTNRSPVPPVSSSGSEFNKKASRIRSGISEASQKIGRLAKLAKRSSMFDDPRDEIEQLTALIHGDITAMNAAISDLQTLRNMEIADGNYSQDRVGHSQAVCDDLKSKLLEATEQVKDVLTARSESIKAHENRKQMFSNSSRDNPFTRQAKPMAEPPPWSNQSNAFASSPQSQLLPDSVQASNQLRRRPAVDGTPPQHMEMSMLQQVAPSQQNYYQSRASALQVLQTSVSEVSGLFTHLSTMVQQQHELSLRIDDHVDQSLSNVENAHGALLRHLNRISSNRWLLIKIFAVVIFFLTIFIFFMA